MTPADILKTIVNVALIAGFVCLAIFTPCPWQFTALAIVATVCPSAIPAIAAALGSKEPPPPVGPSIVTGKDGAA